MFTREFYQQLVLTHQYAEIGAQQIDFRLPGVDRDELRRRWLCHDGGDHFAAQVASDPGTCVVTTGIGLSGVPHAGTLSQITRAIFLQRAGHRVQLVLGDLDAYNGKDRDLAEVRQLAGRYRRFVRALGFDTELGMLRDQFDSLEVLRTMYLAGRHMSEEAFLEAEEDMHGFYAARGKVDARMTFRRKLSLALMTADFIDLTRQGYRNVLVTLGVDEHRYVRFAKGVAALLASHLPDHNVMLAAMYSPIIVGLNGYPKMSKSFPDSGVDLEMTPDDIQRRIVDDPDPIDSPAGSSLVQMLESLSSVSLAELHQALAARQHGVNEWQTWRARLADELIHMQRLWKEEADV